MTAPVGDRRREPGSGFELALIAIAAASCSPAPVVTVARARASPSAMSGGGRCSGGLGDWLAGHRPAAHRATTRRGMGAARHRPARRRPSTGCAPASSPPSPSRSAVVGSGCGVVSPGRRSGDASGSAPRPAKPPPATSCRSSSTASTHRPGGCCSAGCCRADRCSPPRTGNATRYPAARARRQGNRGSVALIGPTGSGKTALAASAIATWDGPVVAVSVKRDLYDTTAAARAARG